MFRVAVANRSLVDFQIFRFLRSFMLSLEKMVGIPKDLLKTVFLINSSVMSPFRHFFDEFSALKLGFYIEFLVMGKRVASVFVSREKDFPILIRG